MRKFLGKGRNVHDKAANALFSWELLTIGVAELVCSASRAVPNVDVAILSWHFGLWSVDCCRVIYVLKDEQEGGGTIQRTGFGYGTLPGHAVSGEEIFSVEWHPATEEVWYDIFSFSRPANWLVQLAAPIARATQRRFARASLEKAVLLASRSEGNASG